MSGCQPRMSCPRALYERTLLPSLATTHAEASRRVIADPLGWEDASGGQRSGSPNSSPHVSTCEAEHEVFLRFLLSRRHPSLRLSPCPGLSPGRSVTLARRLYVSRLANSVKATKLGTVHKDVRCRHCAKDGAFGGHPALQRQELERLVCSAPP